MLMTEHERFLLRITLSNAEEDLKELLERAESDLILSRRDLHIMLDAIPVPLSWAAIPSGEIKFVNRAFKKTFGYQDRHFQTVDQWIDKTYIRESDRILSRARWVELWAKQKSGISEVDTIELQVRCADGSLLTVRHRGILLHDISIGIATFEDITANKLVEETLHRISFEDPLTGLPNRRALQARWMQEMEHGHIGRTSLLALLLIDMDGFKSINDQFGHDVGDETLMAIGERLRACIRSNDLACRLGGDEFLVLLPGLSSPDQAETVCRRISEAFQGPLTLSGQTVQIGVSMGISLYPNHSTELAELMKQADIALYHVKKQLKGGWGWFEPMPA